MRDALRAPCKALHQRHPRRRKPGPALTAAQTPPEDSSGAFPADTRGMFLRVFPSVMLPIFLSIADQTIVATALPAIAGSLGDVEHISWIIVSYLIASTLAAPVYGYLGDRFGRRKLMLVGIGIYAFGAILNSLAPSMIALAATRFIQGLGGGGLMSMSQALIGEVVPPRQRGEYQGYLAAVSVTATAFGPLMGAWLTLTFGWRSVFFIAIPGAMVAALLTLRLKGLPGSSRESWHFDFAGLLFFTGFIVPLLLALQNARSFDATTLPIVAALLALAAAALVLLLRQERRTPSPLLPIDLMRQRTIWMCQLMGVAHGATLTALVAFLPIYLHILDIVPLAQIGWLLLACTASISTSAMLTGRFITRTGLTMIVPSIGMVIASASMVNFAFNAPHMSFAQLIVAIVVMALGMGTVMSVIQVVIQLVAGRRQLGAAAGSTQLARSVGAATGTALFSTVLFASLAASDTGAADIFARILEQGRGSLDALSLDRRATVMGDVAAAFRNAYLLLAAICAGGAVLSWINPTRRV